MLTVFADFYQSAIESINVLKMHRRRQYGARAANGVLFITPQGKDGRSVNLSDVSGSLRYEEQIDVFGADDFRNR
jgi:hypothetical protein